MILLGGLLLSGCNSEIESEPFELELRLAVSASGLSMRKNAPSSCQNEGVASLRAFGDPGTTEKFEFPNRAYIYFVWSEGGDPEVINVQTIVKELDDNLWKEDENHMIYSATGDPVYVYTHKFFSLLDNKKKRVWGKVYVAASYGDIAPYVKGSSPKVTEPTSEADVLNLVFDNNTTTIQSNLQNIYSTPYNYEVNDKFYGTIAGFAYDESESEAGSKVAYVNLLLYHVAAKVDLMWNVKENLRGDVKISYIAAEHLYDGPSYVFKPTKNQPASENLGEDHVYTGGYTKEILNEATPCPGTQWNGRAYFYAIPYKNNDVDGESNPDPHYPLQLTLCKGTDRPAGGHYYSQIVKTEVPDVWTSWIRGQISINTATYNVTP